MLTKLTVSGPSEAVFSRLEGLFEGSEETKTLICDQGVVGDRPFDLAWPVAVRVSYGGLHPPAGVFDSVGFTSFCGQHHFPAQAVPR